MIVSSKERRIRDMTFTVYNSQGIPVTQTGDELEAQILADIYDGWYR